ncbi:MAG: hypothetical protein HKN91_00270, partial [Acidimicrobiia bacterium]|nr:hypothetical protein [Acidimicrobiia bacterium]
MSDDSVVALPSPRQLGEPDLSPARWVRQNPQLPPVDSGSSLWRHIREVGRRLWLAVLLGAVLGGAMYFYRSQADERFESQAVVRLVVSDDLADDGSITQFQSRQLVELTLTPTLVGNAAATAELNMSAAEAQELIQVELRSTPGFADVTAEGPTADEARRLAQATAEVMAAAGGDGSGGRISVIEPASLPSQPLSDNALRDALLVGFASSVLAAEGSVLLRKLRGKVSPVDPSAEISRLTGLPTFDLRGSADSAGSVPSFFATHLYGARVVTVIQRGNPASVSLATELAATASKFSLRVLLLDADSGPPVMHERLGHPQSPGLAEVLAGGASLRSAVRRASTTNPTAILTAGSSEAAI